MRYTILEQFDVPATYVYAHLYYWEEDDSVSGGHSSYAYCWNSWFPGWTIEDWSSTYYPHGPDYVWIEVEGEFQNDLNIEYEVHPTIMDSETAPGVGNEPGRHVSYVHTLH